MKRYYLMLNVVVLSLLYCATRLFFIRPLAVYYDSFEYVRFVEFVRWGSLWSQVWSTHQPVHVVYLLPVAILHLSTNISAVWIFTVTSVLSGWLVMLLTYFLVRDFFNDESEAPFWSGIFLCLFPLWFSATTNIVYEPWLLLWQLATVWLALRFLQRGSIVFLAFAALAFSMAQSIFIGSLFFVPVLGVLLFHDAPKNWKRAVILVASLVAAVVFFERVTSPSWNFVFEKYFSHATDVPIVFDGWVKWFARVARNVGIHIVLQLGIIGALWWVAGIVRLATRDKKTWWFLFLLTLPYFLIMQYWHAGLFGRVSMGFIVPASVVLARAFSRAKTRGLIAVTLAIPLLFRAVFQLTPTHLAFEYQRLFADEHTEKTAVFTTDAARFLYEKNEIPIFIIRGYGNELEQQQQFIREQKAKGNRVLIDQFAKNFPRRQPDGWDWHIFSVLTSQASRMP